MPTSPRAEALRGAAACHSPAVLPLVDRVFDGNGHSKQVAIAEMKQRVCLSCPIAEQCLHLGMLGEHGVWGGTGRKQRTQAGAPKPPTRL